MSDILPATAILEIEMEEPKIIQVGNYMDDSGKGFKNPQCGRVYSPDGIAPTLNTCGGGQREPKIIQIGSYVPNSMCAGKIVDAEGIAPTVMENHGMPTAVLEPAILTPIRTEEQRQLRKQGIDTFGGRQMLPRTDGVSNTITTVQKDNLLQEPSILGYTRDSKGRVERYHEKDVAGTIHASSGSGGNTDQFVKEPCGCYDNQFGEFFRPPLEGVSRTVKTDGHNAVLLKYRIRKLTPTECFRLMGVDDSDIDKLKSTKFTQTLKSGKVKEKPMPKTQLYKMAGNSIVVDVLYHIFYQMFIAEPPKPKSIQKSLFD